MIILIVVCMYTYIYVYNYVCSIISFTSPNLIEIIQFSPSLNFMDLLNGSSARRCMLWCLSFDILTFFGATSQHPGSNRNETWRFMLLCYIVSLFIFHCWFFKIFKTMLFLIYCLWSEKGIFGHFPHTPPIYFVFDFEPNTLNSWVSCCSSQSLNVSFTTRDLLLRHCIFRLSWIIHWLVTGSRHRSLVCFDSRKTKKVADRWVQLMRFPLIRFFLKFVQQFSINFL